MFNKVADERIFTLFLYNLELAVMPSINSRKLFKVYAHVLDHELLSSVFQVYDKLILDQVSLEVFRRLAV